MLRLVQLQQDSSKEQGSRLQAGFTSLVVGELFLNGVVRIPDHRAQVTILLCSGGLGRDSLPAGAQSCCIFY